MLKKLAIPSLLITLALTIIAFLLIFNQIYYPVKYKNEVNAAAQKNGIATSLIFAVINTESHFRKDAESSAGAVGLMQIMPSTATWIAEEMDLKDFSCSELKDPKTNIEIGTFYLRYLIDKFQDTKLAVAAYNAGEGNVTAWLKVAEYSDGVTLKRIPFKETREYVSRVMKSHNIYVKKLNAKNQSVACLD